MLGVPTRRDDALQALEREGLIAHRRAIITIIDREGLQAHSNGTYMPLLTIIELFSHQVCDCARASLRARLRRVRGSVSWQRQPLASFARTAGWPCTVTRDAGGSNPDV
mgnify:CR=1 FL=1